MKVFNRFIELETKKRQEEVNIKELVEAILFESGVSEGLITVFTGHTTAGVHLSNEDRALEQDFHDFLNESIPDKASYRHDRGDFGRNATAHFKSVLVGNSVTLPVTKGKIMFGKWQTLYFSEFDGPRRREVFVKVIGVE